MPFSLPSALSSDVSCSLFGETSLTTLPPTPHPLPAVFRMSYPNNNDKSRLDFPLPASSIVI